MPRTKQNHPKNLKDKIQEAQKELKEPKSSTKVISESSRRNADSIKGLKRKKVVAENQLRKIPKSPVKKPPLPKTSEPPSEETAPSSDHGDQRYGNVAPPLPEKDPPPPYVEGLKSTDEERSSPSPPVEGDRYHSNAPLDVLLKAMEPDFSTLAERRSSPPAVDGSLQTPLPHMQTYYIDKQGNVIGMATPAQHFLPLASGPEKPGLHLNFNASITHAPVPSGIDTLPQSQPPVVHTCQSLSASVPSTVQVPVTPGTHQVQMTAVVNFSAEHVASKDQKPKKLGKYVCEYCSRACAKPSVLLKHIRSHTGERPYPCVTCGFSFKTKSNLYKHKKSHAHAIKLGLVARSESGGGSLSQESDKNVGTHSEGDESGDSDEEGSLDPDSSQSSLAASSESSLHSAGTTRACHTDAELTFESLKMSHEPKVPGALPKVVVYPVNVSPLRADSPRVTGAAPEQAAAQRQRDCQTANPRSNVMVLSSLKEVDGANPSLSDDEDQHCKSPPLPPLGGHAQLQRQQATDFSQQQQPKCLLSPRSLGSTDSGYFSRSESADQAMSPPSPFVKITPPPDTDVVKNTPPPVVMAMHVVRATDGQMRPPLEANARSLEERISKLISDNEAVVDNKQLDSVKPRRTSLSRKGSIDSPKSYIFKDSFQFDLKPIGRRSSSSSDIPKSPFTPTDKSKPVLLLSVPPQYPHMDCLPITRSNSMPTTPGHSTLPLNVAPIPYRIYQSFDEKISSLNDDVFSSAPSTPNPIHTRTLVRQTAVEDFSSSESHSLPTVRSMDEGSHSPSGSVELMQRSRSFEDRNRKSQQIKGTMYECETCRNRYRKLENFETHKKFYCSELHGPKNKPAKEVDLDVFQVNVPQAFAARSTPGLGILDHQTSIRKRRKKKSVGDEDDQSPTDVIPPCSVSFELPANLVNRTFSLHTLLVDVPQIQLAVTRGVNPSDSRLSPIRETQTSPSNKAELQRQGSGTSVIRHTNSLSRPNSFETESLDKVDNIEKDSPNNPKTDMPAVSADSCHETISKPKPADYGPPRKEQGSDGTANCTPVHQSRLVRQNNIQVPEILVTEDSDREHESQTLEAADKPADQFSWPQRSESLSKLPAEKLPPKKKRIRLAQMDQSSGESSFESGVSRSLSRDSSLSRCSSISASFERDEPAQSESPSRAECAESQCPPAAFNTLGVPGVMRRAASEQITCTQPSIEVSCGYRSKSFDCGSALPVSPPKPGQGPQVPLIERRRGPLVRQMSLKISPESQQPVRKPIIPLEKPLVTSVSSFSQSRSQQIHIASRRSITQPFVLHAGEQPLLKNEHMIQSINLGSPTQEAQVHGLPHPWHQTSKVQICQKIQPLKQILVCHGNVPNEAPDSEEKNSFVPKYQLQCPGQTFSFSSAQGPQIALPVLTIPIASTILSKSSEVIQNVCVAQPTQQSSHIKTIVLSGEQQRTQTGSVPLPQILITHPASSVSNKSSPLSSQSVESDAIQTTKRDRVPTGGTSEQAPSLGSFHCTQKLTSVTLCPQQEPTASSKRMLSPANSLDIYMEKHQKRAKDEHGAACLTDGRSLNYLNAKMSEVTRQRKLMLVRQVCTTEPADSPIETEAPPLPDVQPDGDKELDDIKPMSPDAVGLEKDTTSVVREEVSSVSNAAPGQDDLPPAANTPKPQEKAEEQRWIPSKSPIRPSSFHGGQVKLTTSVSVVNTKDSQRLSFPSLKTATTFTWCFLMKRKPLHAKQSDLKTSAYSSWTYSPNNPNPLGLPTKVVLSLFDSKQSSKKVHYTSAIKTDGKADILSYTGQLKDVMAKLPITQNSAPVEKASKTPAENPVSSDSDKDPPSAAEPRRVKIFDGGYKSNEEYVYVRGRGRGKYICEECGIRCKKPSMLRKHIRTHSDVRPYHCVHCNFSFKTKGNLTKHMKSKAHSKKCVELGVPEGLIEDQDAEDSGERGPTEDGDESDEENEENEEEEEEEEEDSQAESEHGTEAPPSALLAQMSLSPAPLRSGSTPAPPPPDSCPSDSDSVAMMSPVSPCRQMSIDFDAPPPSPPAAPAGGSRPAQDTSGASSESGVPVDRGTQTIPSLFPPPPTTSQTPGPGAHLFSHLPLHSQQPPRSAYGMVPVGGIQLVPAGLAAYSTFVPVQAGPVQLTIPAVGVIHQSGEAETSQSQVLPCFPLAQAVLAPPQLLNAALGLQVLAANPPVQGASGPPGLHIVNIALPAIIPSLSPLPTLSPEPPPPPHSPHSRQVHKDDMNTSERPSSQRPDGPLGNHSPEQAAPPGPPTASDRPTTPGPFTVFGPPKVSNSSTAPGPLKIFGPLTASDPPTVPGPIKLLTSPTILGHDTARSAPTVSNTPTVVSPPTVPAPPTVPSWQKDDGASSEDEDRLVIAT